MPRGVKTCPACNTGCGPRTFVCACGHVFKTQTLAVKAAPEPMQVQQRQEQSERPKERPQSYRVGSTEINIPAGKCPVKPQGEWPHTQEEIETWAVDVVEAGRKRDLHYTSEAVRYWAQIFWPTYKDGKENKEVVRVKELINKVLD